MKTLITQSQASREMNRHQRLPKSNTSFQNTSPVYCDYYKICPDNIHHYSMKCLKPFNENCLVKKFYDRWRIKKEIEELFIGSKI